MIPIEDFEKAYKLMKKHGLDVHINSSNLLGLMLTGELFETDGEIDFNTFDADNNLVKEMCTDPSFTHQSMSATNTGICYFSFPTPMGLGQVKLLNGFAYDNVGTDYFHVWPQEWFLPHRIFKWRGFELKVPTRPDKVLQSIYGEDWTVRKLNWAWMNCPSLINANSPEEAIKIYESIRTS